MDATEIFLYEYTILIETNPHRPTTEKEALNPALIGLEHLKDKKRKTEKTKPDAREK